jgi:hypothetical protein
MNHVNSLRNITYVKNHQAELYSKTVLSDAVDILLEQIGKDNTQSIILIGGYGRGEGGVVYINHSYRPHNNFDLMIFVKKSISKKQLDIINFQLESIRKAYDIGIDISVETNKKFANEQCRVIWYDIYHGHKVLWGDINYVKKSNRFEYNDIPAWDIRNLLVNRSSLLLINKYILSHSINDSRRRNVIKHFIKAIVGYGDALLFMHGKYHWSYAQKQLNMVSLQCSGDVFQDIAGYYDFAIEFRFRPNYECFEGVDLNNYNNNLIRTFEDVHLSYENFRLNENLKDWHHYRRVATVQRVKELYSSLPIALKTIRKCLHQQHSVYCQSKLYLSEYLLPQSELLPILMPELQYMSAKKFKNLCFKQKLQKLLIRLAAVY